MSLPPISVIIPVHNGAGFYDGAIDSVLQQQWPTLEIVIVDDGSNDRLNEVIETRGVPVRYLRQPQRGPAAARNLGLRAARSEFIAFLDVDDRWTPAHLTRSYEALRADPEAGISQGLMQQFVMLADGRCLMSGAYRLPYLGTCLFRRDVLEGCGYFDESMPLGEDFDLMFRCWERDQPKRCIDHVSLLYRRHAGNMTRGRTREANLWAVQRRMQRVRRGDVDPALPRRFALGAYIGDISGFSDVQIDVAEKWNL